MAGADVPPPPAEHYSDISHGRHLRLLGHRPEDPAAGAGDHQGDTDLAIGMAGQRSDHVAQVLPGGQLPGAGDREDKEPAPRLHGLPIGPRGIDPQGEAEACFLKAIEIAQRQQAKSWELRASTSLARLWQQQGKKKEAHKLLAEIYGWFTEGFDTADLKEAKALLDSLGSSV